MNTIDVGFIWKQIVSEDWFGRWDNVETAIASDLKILFLIAVCRTPTLYVNPNLRKPCTLVLASVFVLRILVHTVKLLSVHMTADREAVDWARRNHASRRDCVLMWMFPGSLMGEWRKESLLSGKHS